MNLNIENMKYDEYQLEDFLTDEFFIEWVKNPNENNTHFWERWIAEHSEKRELVVQASNWIKRFNYANSVELSDRDYVEIFENVVRLEPKKDHNPIQSKQSIRTWFLSFRQVAALLVFGLFIGWLWMDWGSSRQVPEKMETVAELVKRNTPLGAKSTFILEDGSKIYLNAGSEIEFPKSFPKEERKVYLKGEAFFEIKQESRPFIVSTDQVEVKVLGTSFNVKESSQGRLSVALVSGKVKINDRNGNQLMLEPNEMMTFTQQGEFFKSGFDPLEVAGWKDKMLVFKNSSIYQVKEKLESWYGVKVNLRGIYPSTWAYSGVYQDESLENVLQGISKTSSIQVTLEGKNATIIHQ